MSKQQAPLKEGEEVPQVEDSNELESELNGTSENVGRNGLSCLGKGKSSRDESYKRKATSGVSSNDDARMTPAEQLSDGEEESNSHASKEPPRQQFDKPTDSYKRVEVSENDTTTSSASTASLLGRSSLNFAPPSVDMIPPQAGLLPMASQSVSLSHLLQAEGTSLNIAPLLLPNQLSSVPPFLSLSGLPHMPQADAQVEVSGNDTASSSASTVSLLGQALNVAPPSVGMIPPQAGLLPMASQSVSLSYLLQAQAPATSLNIAPLRNRPSSAPPILSLIGSYPHNISQPQVQAQRTSLDTSLLNQLGSSQPLPLLADQVQAQVPSMPSLIELLQLAPLAQNNVTGLPHVPQAPTVPFTHTAMMGQLAATQANQSSLIVIGQLLQLESLSQNNVSGFPHVYQAPTVSSLQTSMSGQLAAAQANQSSYPPPNQSTSALTNMNWLQMLSVYQNPYFPIIDRQIQSQLVQSLIQDNMIKDQVIELILSQQQTGVPNNSSTSAQMMPLANHLELLLRNSTTGPASNSELALQGASSVAVSAYSLQHQSTQNISSSATSGAISNIDSERSTEATASGVAASGHLHTPHQSKEKRWMMRYEELKQFRQKHGHCRARHGYVENLKLSWWVMNQRAQHQLLKQGKKNWLSEDRMALLDAIGFDWNPIIGKPQGK